MSSTEMERYRIEGLDCASCANEVERQLRTIKGFEKASVTYSTGVVTIPAGTRELAERTIAQVEPDARLTDHDRTVPPSDRESEETARRRSMLARIVRFAAALALTAAGTVFNEVLHATPLHIAEYAVFLTAYLLVGWPVVSGAVRNIVRGRVFDELFLMTVATLGAIVIHELTEAVAVMLFYSVGEYVQESAVGRSRRSISSLMDLRPEFARTVADGATREVDPDDVPVGAWIEVRSGERVPLDGEIVAGETAFDTSALTGESTPRAAGVGDGVLAGFVNGSSTVRIRVTRPFAESSVSRILELVEEAAARKAPTERFISRLARVYTPIVVGIAAAIAFVPPLILSNATLGEWVYRALVMLVISCPCALVISVPLGYFGGIGGASRNGILVKGAHYLDQFTDLGAVVVDKTGTLTRGRFEVISVKPCPGFDEQSLLRYAAMAEIHSTHPIARSIRTAYVGEIDADSVTDVSEERGFGVAARHGSSRILVGSDRLMRHEGIAPLDLDATGTVVHVAIDGAAAGAIVIADEVKPEAAATVHELRRLGVERIVMLTGDNPAIADRVARETGIDEVHAGLMPEEKVARVEAIADELSGSRAVAFVGDGINDAPVLMRADIGIAMGALGSDAAIEAADVVLMDDRMSGVVDSIAIARHTRRVVLQNIALALLVKAVFLTLGAFGLATMWEAVIADMGTSLLAVLNATRTLRYGRSAQERRART